MAASASVVLPSPRASKDGSRFIDSTYLQKQSHVPSNFKWPEEDVVSAQQELNAPVVDLEGFFKGDIVATENAAKIITLLKKGSKETECYQSLLPSLGTETVPNVILGTDIYQCLL
ncbi:hypothetical protein Pyn_06391 [Prunus yedoensis var. nudiflora]|uniref:Uncharacterized protein n=1 Tax=Prunus yedoensis var. nudiflora TaxID=2094558 RepID=A0A314Z743_PRUYE|nr:hypothetical protein Pyn_06391 [Prunus yedoensis var. nudiflora]